MRKTRWKGVWGDFCPDLPWSLPLRINDNKVWRGINAMHNADNYIEKNIVDTVIYYPDDHSATDWVKDNFFVGVDAPKTLPLLPLRSAYRTWIWTLVKEVWADISPAHAVVQICRIKLPMPGPEPYSVCVFLDDSGDQFLRISQRSLTRRCVSHRSLTWLKISLFYYRFLRLITDMQKSNAKATKGIIRTTSAWSTN